MQLISFISQLYIYWSIYGMECNEWSIVFILIQVRLRTEVPSTLSSTRPGFELMPSRSWQYISCHGDACSNHSAISDFTHTMSPLSLHHGSLSVYLCLHNAAFFSPSLPIHTWHVYLGMEAYSFADGDKHNILRKIWHRPVHHVETHHNKLI